MKRYVATTFMTFFVFSALLAAADLEKKEYESAGAEEELSVEHQQIERTLAKSMIKKGSVLGEIKRLPQDRVGKGISVKEAVAHVQEPHPLPLVLPAEMPYTQTEGDMKVILGEEFEPISGPHEADIQEQIRSNIVKILRTKARTDGEAMVGDAGYVDQLTQAALEERRHPKQYVFYHATENKVGFLYDVITEFRKQLMASSDRDTVMLRGVDQAFAELMKETGQEGIGGLIQKFKIGEEREAYDYHENYQDFAISANAFLFGSLEMGAGEATFQYFFNNSSVNPPHMQEFFNYLGEQLGLHLDFNRYESLLEKTSACGDIKNGRLYQIFIEPNYVDQMAYAAIVMGGVFATSAMEDAPKSSKIKHLLDIMRTDPDDFSRFRSQADPRGPLQARLLLKPEWMMDPRIVQVKRYWRCPELQAPYLMQLRKLVSEDLEQYLLSHRAPKEEALAPGGDVLRRQYKAVYEQATGKEYTSVSQGPLEELKELIEADDVGGLQRWSGQHHDVTLLIKPLPVTDYRAHTPQSFIPLDLALREEKFRAARYIWENIAPSIDASAAMSILSVLSAPLTKEKFDSYLRESGDLIKALFEKMLENKNNNQVAEFICNLTRKQNFNRPLVMDLIDRLTPEQLNAPFKTPHGDNQTLLGGVIMESSLDVQGKLAFVEALVKKGSTITVEYIDRAMRNYPFDRTLVIYLIDHSIPKQLNVPFKTAYGFEGTLLEDVIEEPSLARLAAEDKLALVKALVEKGATVGMELVEKAFYRKPFNGTLLMYLIGQLTPEQLNAPLEMYGARQTLLEKIIAEPSLNEQGKLALVKAIVEKGATLTAESVNRAVQSLAYERAMVVAVYLIDQLTPEQLNAPFKIPYSIKETTLLESVVTSFPLAAEDKLHLVKALVEKGAIVEEGMLTPHLPQDTQAVLRDALARQNKAPK